MSESKGPKSSQIGSTVLASEEDLTDPRGLFSASRAEAFWRREGAERIRDILQRRINVLDMEHDVRPEVIDELLYELQMLAHHLGVSVQSTIAGPLQRDDIDPLHLDQATRTTTGVGGACEVGNECGRLGCPSCQQ